MDMNKAMVELYKQKSSSAKKKSAQSHHKKPPINIATDKLGQVADDGLDRKQAKIEDVLASFEYKPRSTFDQLHGCESTQDQALKILERFRRSINQTAKKSDWPTLICGSHGLGKTSIVEALANHAELKLIPLPLKNLIEQTGQEFKATLKLFLGYCKANQPAVVLIDDLDQLSNKEDFKYSVRGVIRQLLDEENQLLLFCTSSSVLHEISGIDFLYNIQLKRPRTEARNKILQHLRENNKNLHRLSDDDLSHLAIKTPSFTALDLRKMLDIAETESTGEPIMIHCDKAIDVIKQSFRRGTHLIGEKPTITWSHIGGLPEVRHAFLDILRQIKKGHVNCKFAGIALYGPPGCGKTMVAQAMANEAGLNFISIKPAELVDKFLGETERNIRRVFSEAQEHEPCMIYFDEFDGLCGTRGNRDNVTSAIQTLLSEMDGFAGRGKSIILVSTNRLEDIDPAMKRPGRLSKHIYVGPPSEKARREILEVITKRPTLRLADDVDLGVWAGRTDCFTGADLDFLVSEAESNANSHFNSVDDDVDMMEETTLLRQEHFEQAMKKIKTTNKELGKKIKLDECSKI